MQIMRPRCSFVNILVSLGLIALNAASIFLPQMHRLKWFFYPLICSYYCATITRTFLEVLIGYNF
jgi:hypothetical protein